MTREEIERTRAAAWATIARVENKQDLNALKEEEGNQKFLEKTRELWREIATHENEDLDAKTALFLLRLAGIDIDYTKVKKVKKGGAETGCIHLDTGGRHGVVSEDEGKTVYFDHHGPQSGRDTSATKILAETLVNLGLLPTTTALDKLVEFVTRIDNKTLLDEEKYVMDAEHYTLVQMQRYIPVGRINRLHKFFQANHQPTEILTEDGLKDFVAETRIKEHQDKIEKSEAKLKELTDNGWVIQSPKYGKILIDIGKQIPLGYDAAKWAGYDGYVIWNMKEKGLFITTKEEMPRDLLSQGQNIRGTMWVDGGQEITLSIEQVAGALMGQENYVLSDRQKKYMESVLAAGREDNRE